MRPQVRAIDAQEDVGTPAEDRREVGHPGVATVRAGAARECGREGELGLERELQARAVVARELREREPADAQADERRGAGHLLGRPGIS